MKFNKQKSELYSFDENWKGKKKGYNVHIRYSGSKLSTHYNRYYFSIYGANDFRFNSLWNDIHFENYEECAISAEKYVDELVLSKSE